MVTLRRRATGTYSWQARAPLAIVTLDARQVKPFVVDPAMLSNRYGCMREAIRHFRAAGADSDFIAIGMHDLCGANGTAERTFGLDYGTGESGQSCAPSILHWKARFQQEEPTMPVLLMQARAPAPTVHCENHPHVGSQPAL
jgi:hypothetical protein